jgi:hypothetical protein
MWVSCHIRSLYFFLANFNASFMSAVHVMFDCSMVFHGFSSRRPFRCAVARKNDRLRLHLDEGGVRDLDSTCDTEWRYGNARCEVTRCETTVLIRTVDYCTILMLQSAVVTVMERLWGGHVLRFFLNPFLVFPSSRFPNGSTLVPRLYFQFQRHHHEIRSISNFKHNTITKSQPWDEKW